MGGFVDSIFPGLGGLAKKGMGAVMPMLAPPPAPPVAPTLDNSGDAIQAAQAEQLRRSNAGRASTILTGGQGVTTNAKTASATLTGQP